MSVTTYTSCLKITRTDAVVLGLTELDQDITHDSVTYQSAVGYTPTSLSTNDQLSVNNADVEGVLAVLGIDREDIRAGLYDNAEIEWFIFDYTAEAVVKTMLRGNWGETKLLNGRFVAEFRSLAQTLQQTIGEVTSPTCRAQFGDSRCGLTLATYTVTGTLTSVTDNREFRDNSRTEAADYFNYGLLTWTGGNNNGQSMEVRDFQTNGTFTLFKAMFDTVQVGDTYSVSAGCDKQVTTCQTKFAASNIVNFRGEPHLPGRNEIAKFGGQ